MSNLIHKQQIKIYETAEEVFPKLGYSTKGALLKACQRKEVPHIRMSPRKVLFDPDEINRFLEGKKINAIGQNRKMAGR